LENSRWYQLSVDDSLRRLNTSHRGLSADEISKRLEQYGYNEIRFKKPSVIMRFLRQFHNPLVYILLAAATVTGILTLIGSEDMFADTVVILAVVILNAILGFFQEGKTEAALEALRKIIVQECTVLRDGEKSVIPARELVPGDIVLLEAGNKIPADVRLFNTKNLHIDEAILTGESIPVAKHEDSIARSNLSPGDQRCIAFSGTFITRGSAQGIVAATGEKTEFGKVAKLVRETKRVVTPLQKQIAIFTKFLMIAILGIGLLNFILGYVFGYTTVYSFLASVSLVVAAIPEMLPMLVTAILALAAAVMVKRNALIRRLAAAETLGSTTVICSDKTGTLTKNQMTVVSIYAGGNNYKVSGVGYEPDGDFIFNDMAINPMTHHSALVQTLRAGFLCNNARLVRRENTYQIIGDPTEGALVVSAKKVNIDHELHRLDEIPFESEQQYMATLHEGQDENIIFAKGAPEKVLQMCHDQQMNDGVFSLKGEEILDRANNMAHDALRVLGMAYKKIPANATLLNHGDMQGFTFLGLQGMIDPPREEAISAIEKCKKAGIRSIMITGDHLQTARAVALQLGITDVKEDDVLSGEELAGMSDEELYNTVGKVSVYARVAPEHKLRIARQLQRRGEIVAMTGDGVNDAPALKAADIGIAMGITGTEVSREASEMVLTDDNFASIVAAVDEGRHAWRNLEKAILYTIPTNGGQALLVIGAVMLAPLLPIFSARLTLEPVMILWINLFDSVFLTMPLMMEPKDKGILDEPPRSPQAKLANLLLLRRVTLIGLMIAIPGFLVYNHFGASAVSAEGVILNPLLLSQAQTAAFWAVLMVHFGYVMSARSVYNSAFTFNPFSNKWLLLGITASILFRLLPTFVPAASSFFRTAEFPLEWWIYILPCLLPGFIAIELEKLIIRQWRKRKSQ
jgi:magnesium-transporting ATPase (P-type)